MTKQILVLWVANDGTVFTDRADCEQYEKRTETLNKVQNQTHNPYGFT